MSSFSILGEDPFTSIYIVYIVKSSEDEFKEGEFSHIKNLEWAFLSEANARTQCAEFNKLKYGDERGSPLERFAVEKMLLSDAPSYLLGTYNLFMRATEERK